MDILTEQVDSQRLQDVLEWNACCAGHFKHHYEIMLGVKLKTLEVVSSPLDSNGKNPCVIRFAVQ